MSAYNILPNLQDTFVCLASTTPSIPTTFPGQLSETSQIFYRPDSSTSGFYYFQAFQITVSTFGVYKLRSVSTFDTRGYLYQNSFDSSDPKINLLKENDDGGTQMQFLIEADLQSGRVYVLVVTTHRENIKGNFSVLVTGPNTVMLTSITPSTSRPITMRKYFPPQRVCLLFNSETELLRLSFFT